MNVEINLLLTPKLKFFVDYLLKYSRDKVLKELFFEVIKCLKSFQNILLYANRKMFSSTNVDFE